MKPFLLKVLLLIIPVVLVMYFVLLIPPTKTEQQNLYFAQIDKKTLLENTKPPRIIFVGGSNLSLGLNSQKIKDSLQLNPVNTAVHASLGLKYMLRSIIKYVQKGDVVVVSPEYQQFYGDLADGGDELLSTIYDVAPDNKSYVDALQYFKLLRFVPKLYSSKINLFAYFSKFTPANPLYNRKSFNEYGDAYKHWLLPKTYVEPLTIDGELNQDVFEVLDGFRNQVGLKNAKLLITFPCYQDISFKRGILKIKNVEQRLKNHGYVLLGTPERYVFQDSLTFDTPYHLTGRGVQIRTQLLIADLRKVLNKR